MAEIKANSTIGGLQIASVNDIPSGSVVVRDPLLDFHFTETHKLDNSTLNDDPNNNWDVTGTVPLISGNLIFETSDIPPSFSETYYHAVFYGKITAIPSSVSKTANKDVLVQFVTEYSDAPNASATTAVRVKVYRGSTVILQKEIPRANRSNFYIPSSLVGSGITKIEVLANGDWWIRLTRITVRQVDANGDTQAGTSLLEQIFIQRHPFNPIARQQIPLASRDNNVEFSPSENVGWNKVTYDPEFQNPSVVTAAASDPFNWGTGQYKPSVPGYYYVESSIQVGNAGRGSSSTQSAMGAIIKNCDTPANAAAALEYSDWGFSLFNSGQERLSGSVGVPISMSYGNVYQLPLGPDSNGTSGYHAIVHCSGIVYLDGNDDYVTTWVYSYNNAGSPNIDLVGSSHQTYFLAYLLKGV